MEALILYLVLFFPGAQIAVLSGSVETLELIRFSLSNELSRILTYTVPSLALLWYLVIAKKNLSLLKPKRLKKADFLSFGVGFLGLASIGLAIGFLISFFSQYADLVPPPKTEAPVNVLGWTVIVFSCLLTGYLEESYFRYYLLNTQESSMRQNVERILASAFLFSLCHIYEGAWGFANAALAGLFLSVLFIRYRSLHGIAWAHGAYNIFVYVMGIFI